MRSRSRYFKTSSAAKPVFQWVGDPVTPLPPTGRDRKLDLSDQLNYPAFKLGQLEVQLGDFILIRSESNTDNLIDCDVARLDRLYEDFDNKSDPYRAVVTWLCRPQFMPPRLKTEGHGLDEQGAPPLHDQFEVVGEAREFKKDISAETVYYKCTVIKGEIDEDPVTFNKTNKKKDSYPCYLQRFGMKMYKNKSSKKTYMLEALTAKTSGLSKILTKSPKVNLAPLQSSNNVKDLNYKALVEKNLTKIKRKLSSSEVSESPAKRTRAASSGSSKDPSPELSSFVRGTVSPSLKGGYWDEEKVGKRTPKKPKKFADEESGKAANNDQGSVRSRRNSSASAPATPVRLKPVVSTDRFTKVETATGSGRKITIKCGQDKKKFAPSSGLVSGQINSILDSDEDGVDLAVKSPAKKVPTSKTKSAGRVRRASVSCTTPTRMKITSVVTPVKINILKRPASEVKKGRRSLPAQHSDDSDDDFVPVRKSGKKGGRKIEVTPDNTSSSESEDSDEDLEVSFNHKKGKKTSTRAKSSKTPTKATGSKTPTKTAGPKTPKRVFKPSVAPRSKPLTGQVDPLTEAQQRLHVSAVPDSLPCREEEFAEIFGYVESKLKEGTGGCYYISGVPGTGKTATVMEVIRYLQDNNEDYPEFNFHQINGMRLTSPEQAYVEMWRQMTGEKATSEHAMKLLDARFNKAAPKRLSTVFLVDELDMLCNRKQSVLYNMFDWPSKPQGKLIILAIANTMDLPERVMINRVSSRLGLTRQTFQPYTHTQLQAIVASRLEGLQVFKQDAIQLVARKVASLSGDARRALDICRRATEMAETAGEDKIGVGHVTRAHQEMFSSPKILAIRSCSEYEQLLLRVMVGEFHRTGVEETTVGAVFRELTTSLRTEGLECLSLPGTCSMVARLSAQRLVLAEHLRQGLDTKLRLNVASEDINFALKKDDD